MFDLAQAEGLLSKLLIVEASTANLRRWIYEATNDSKSFHEALEDIQKIYTIAEELSTILMARCDNENVSIVRKIKDIESNLNLLSNKVDEFESGLKSFNESDLQILDHNSMTIILPQPPLPNDDKPLVTNSLVASKKSRREPTDWQLELLHKLFTDDEDESLTYFVAEVKHYKGFNQVCCFCVIYDGDIESAKANAQDAISSGKYSDDFIFDWDYVYARVFVYNYYSNLENSNTTETFNRKRSREI